MKKININSIGRMPFIQKDIEFLMSDPRELFPAMVKELGLGQKQYFVISGCRITVTANRLTMTPGWAYHNGEVLPVRGLTNVDVSSITGTRYVVLTKTTYYDPNGARSFKKPDQTTVNKTDVWQDDYLSPTVTNAASASGFCIEQGAWTLAERLRKGIADDSGWILTGDIYYRRVGRTVFLKGHHHDDGLVGYTNHLIASVPAPAEGESYFPPTAANVSMVKIDSSGNLTVSGSAGAHYYFNHIVYMTDSVYTDTDDKTYNIVGGGGGGQRS